MSSVWLTTGGTIPAHFRGMQTADHRIPMCSEELHLGSQKKKKKPHHNLFISLFLACNLISYQITYGKGCTYQNGTCNLL